MSPSMWANRKNPRTACIIVVTEESISPASPSCPMYLDMLSLDPEERVKPVALAPGEPPAQLGCVQPVGVPEVAGQVEAAASLAVEIVVGWNGKRMVGPDMSHPRRRPGLARPARRQHDRAPGHAGASLLRSSTASFAGGERTRGWRLVFD